MSAVRGGFHRGNPSLPRVSQVECYSCKKVFIENSTQHPIQEKVAFCYSIPIASVLHSYEFN